MIEKYSYSTINNYICLKKKKKFNLIFISILRYISIKLIFDDLLITNIEKTTNNKAKNNKNVFFCFIFFALIELKSIIEQQIFSIFYSIQQK
jgi:hypothetical protein